MKSIALLACIASLTSPTLSQDCPVVVDLGGDLGPLSSSPNLLPGETVAPPPLMTSTGDWYFSALGPFGEHVLWKSDGTSGGTHPVDVPQLNGSFSAPFEPRDLIEVGGRVVFRTNNPNAPQLYGTAGTEGALERLMAGELSLKDGSNEGVTFPGFREFVHVSGAALFVGKEGNGFDTELWRTDGTLAGTWRVVDLTPGFYGTVINNLFEAPGGGQAYFSGLVRPPGLEAHIGHELYATDGVGAHLLKDLVPGELSSFPSNFNNLKGKTYFVANWVDGGGALQPTRLWVTDGSSAGTQAVADLEVGQQGMVEAPDGRIYFVGSTPATGPELYAFDETTQQASLVDEVVPGPTGSDPRDLVVLGGAVYFHAKSAQGRELWKAENGTLTLVRDINPGSANGLLEFGQPLLAALGRLWFRAQDGVHGLELWTSDGTASGTAMVKDLALVGGSDPRSLVQLDEDEIWFTAWSPDLGRELWRSDGTALGTQLFADLNPGHGTESSEVLNVFSPDGTSVWGQSVAGSKLSLWTWRAETGLVEIAKIPGEHVPGSRMVGGVVGGRSRAFFLVETGGDRVLWVTDGTLAGTGSLGVEVDDELTVKGAVVYRDRLYFEAKKEFSLRELWVSDGTPTGTHSFFSPEAMPWGFGEGLVHEGQLYFTSHKGIAISGLHVTDGTVAGTVQLTSTPAFDANCDPHDLEVFQGEVVFVARGPEGVELRRTDGTPSGTGLALDVHPGTTLGSVSQLTAVGDRLYFVSNPITPTQVLMSCDAMFAGVATHPLGMVDDPPSHHRILGELDGAAIVLDSGVDRTLFSVPSDLGAPVALTNMPVYLPGDQTDFVLRTANGFYFTMTELGPGFVSTPRLYFTDGTPAGTRAACATSSAVASRGSAALANGGVFFPGFNGATGWELYSLPAAGAYAVDLGGTTSGVVLSVKNPVLGEQVTVRLESIPPSVTLGFVLASFPYSDLTPLLSAPGNANWLDPSSATILTLVPGGPVFQVSYPLPKDPALTGWLANAQAYFVEAGNPLLVTSNGVGVALGM